MTESRTINASKNIFMGLVFQILTLILDFIIRTIFIKTLGQEYLGINGLFTNVLSILSFVELGIGSAICYSMYEPIAKNDKDKICALVLLYKKVYITLGIIIAVLGCLVIPFFNIIIPQKPNIPENIILIYIFFIINTFLSYFSVHIKTLLLASQKEYVINKYKVIIKTIFFILQLTLLLIFKNYILYLVIQILFTLTDNVYISFKAKKLYPYLYTKEKPVLLNDEIKKLYSSIRAFVYYKIGSIVLNSTDNIIISMVIGINAVGIVSNYLLLIGALTMIVGKTLSTITASIGNLNSVGSKESKETVFNVVLFASFWIYGSFSPFLLFILNPFIKWWIGSSYLIDFLSVVALVLHFYINGVQFAGYTYRITMGLFSKYKYIALLASIINILASFYLGYKIGIAGIFFATSIARFFTTSWVDPMLVYKYGFNKPMTTYIFKYTKYLLITLFNILLCYLVVNNIPDYSLLLIILKSLLILFISNFLFFILFRKSEEFKNVLEKLKFLMSTKKTLAKN